MEELIQNKKYSDLICVCETLEIEGQAFGRPLDIQSLAVLMGSYCYMGHLSSARFVGKRHLQSVSTTNPLFKDFEAWVNITKALQAYDYKTVHSLFSKTTWSTPLLKQLGLHVQAQIQERTLDLLSQVYESIGQQQAAEFLGLDVQHVGSYVRERGWDIDVASGNVFPYSMIRVVSK
jgi:hypothetical protein